MSWTVGDVSGSETLTDADHLYNTHVNELRVASDANAASILAKTGVPFKVVALDGTGDYNCDGTADDVQIQAAIDAVNAAGGGGIYIKPGTYDLSVVINIKTGVHITGAGWATKLSYSDVTTPDCAVIVPAQQNDWSLKNLWLWNGIADTTSAVSGAGMKIKYSKNGVVSGCRIEGWGVDGLTIGSGDSTPEHYSENIWIVNNYVKDNGRMAISGIIAQNGLSVGEGKNIYMLNNVIDDFSLCGIDLEGYWLENIILDGNDISCSTRTAVQGHGVGISMQVVLKGGGVTNEVFRNITASNNNIHDLDLSATYYDGAGLLYRRGVIMVACSKITGGSHNIAIENNKIWNVNGLYYAAIYSAGINLNADLKISGNQIRTVTTTGAKGGRGIWVDCNTAGETDTQVIVNGNSINTVASDGIYIDGVTGTVSYALVSNNQIYGASANGINIAGGANATSCSVIGNIIVGCGTAMTNAGTTTLIRSNFGVADS